MTITTSFFLGFFAALIGVIPPGLINMSAAKISLKEGHNRAILFSIGACIIIALQTYVAALFASYISNHPNVVKVLQRVAFIIFVLLTIYFLIIAKVQEKKQKEPKIRSKGSRFFQGAFLSLINVLPIPYHAYMVLTFAGFGWLNFSPISIFSYVSGAVMGSFFGFYLYIFFFDKIKIKSITTQKSMNKLIGIITAIVAIITLINIIRKL